MLKSGPRRVAEQASIVAFLLGMLNFRLALAYEPVQCTIEILNVNSPSEKVTARCKTDKSPCELTIASQIGSTRRYIHVLTVLEPGNAYFSFRLNRAFLRVDDQTYFHMPLGNYGAYTKTIALAPSFPVEEHRDKQPNVQPPLVRIPYDVLATIKITITVASD